MRKALYGAHEHKSSGGITRQCIANYGCPAEKEIRTKASSPGICSISRSLEPHPIDTLYENRASSYSYSIGALESPRQNNFVSKNPRLVGSGGARLDG